nr:MAG TPA: hypothetical protein [Caudoviricetes sp.]
MFVSFVLNNSLNWFSFICLLPFQNKKTTHRVI